MTIVAFVAKLRAAGIAVNLDAAGCVTVAGPAEVLTDQVRAAIAKYQDEIVAVLAAEAEAADEVAVAASGTTLDAPGEPDPSRPCYCCGFGFFWRRAGGPWVCSNCHPAAVPSLVAERRVGVARVPGQRPAA